MEQDYEKLRRLVDELKKPQGEMWLTPLVVHLAEIVSRMIAQDVGAQTPRFGGE